MYNDNFLLFKMNTFSVVRLAISWGKNHLQWNKMFNLNIACFDVFKDADISV